MDDIEILLYMPQPPEQIAFSDLIAAIRDGESLNYQQFLARVGEEPLSARLASLEVKGLVVKKYINASTSYSLTKKGVSHVASFTG